MKTRDPTPDTVKALSGHDDLRRCDAPDFCTCGKPTGAVVDVEERVRRYAGEVVSDGALDVINSVVRFGGGDRHAVFKVTYTAKSNGTDALVVRVSTLSDAAEREQVAREAAVLRALEGSAAPRLLDVCCDGRWFNTPTMCTEFIEGDLPKLRRPLPLQVGSGVERALSSVARILNGPLRGVWSDADERLVLLHGDVIPGNVLWADRPVLIDWEYARLGDPADDVAYIFGQHGLSAAQRQAFWSGYRRWMQQPAFDRIVRRARLWEPVILLGSALWWLERWSARAGVDDVGGVDPSVPKPQSYYLEQAVRRLERFETAVGQV